MNTILFAFMIIVGIVLLLALNKGKGAANHYPYQASKFLLSKAERSFYGVLSQAVGETGIVFAKVRVADVITPRKGLNRSDWQKAFNAVSAKHFDFLICNPGDCSVRLAIELDDASHNSAKAQKRDNLLNAACESANLRLLRIKAAKGYAIAEIKRQIEEVGTLQTEQPDKHKATENPKQISKTTPPIKSISSPDKDLEQNEPRLEGAADNQNQLDSPPCPKCAAPMLRRIAKSGTNAGQEFWGCSTFPKCRGVTKFTTKIS